ncbi:MAG: hydrogenase maturation nickel metallochaperone HypA [Gemmatimonadaceae bacterium]
MHELSIAMDIVEVAAEAAARLNATRVMTVNLKIGRIAGVAAQALLVSYDIAAEGTLLEGSRLAIIDVPLVVWCSHCLEDVTLPALNHFVCPVCGVPAGEIRTGRELEIESLEIET